MQTAAQYFGEICNEDYSQKWILVEEHERLHFMDVISIVTDDPSQTGLTDLI